MVAERMPWVETASMDDLRGEVGLFHVLGTPVQQLIEAMLERAYEIGRDEGIDVGRNASDVG